MRIEYSKTLDIVSMFFKIVKALVFEEIFKIVTYFGGDFKYIYIYFLIIL